MEIRNQRKASYQRGTVVRIKRKNRPDAWVLRYYEYDLDGNRRQKATPFSDMKECPTKATAERKADVLRQKIATPEAAVLFRELADRYEEKGLSDREPTADSYASVVRRLRERWADVRLDWMASHPFDIEAWIKSVGQLKSGAPLANGSRRNLHKVLHRMFEFAMRSGILTPQRNPIGLVELRGLPRALRKVRQHPVLTKPQIEALWNDFEMPRMIRVMIWVALCTGLRSCEVLGLRWEDIDFCQALIHVRRSAVRSLPLDTKSESSEAPVPMHGALAEMLRTWKEEVPVVAGWVFGSVRTERPFHGGSLQQLHLIPVGKRIGIEKLGWHSFRHTYRALLRQSGEPLETQRDLLRHSSVVITEGYGKEDSGLMAKLKSANARVVEIFPLAKRA